MIYDAKHSAKLVMANSGSFLIAVLVFVSVLNSASAAARRDRSGLRTKLNFVPAMQYGKLSETACFTPNKTSDMYVAIPKGVFKNGAACKKTLRVQCAEPYRDLGGPWRVCKTKKIFVVTVIDQVLYETVDDNLFHLSKKAFSKMAMPGADSIRLIIYR